MKKEILLWVLIAWQTAPTFADQPNVKNDTQKNIIENFSDTKKSDNTNYEVSAPEILEALQNSLKNQIIKGVLTYFEKDVTFILEPNEKLMLGNEISDYLGKYPNIIKLDGNKVLLNLDDKNFKELFRVLLPYLWKWKELSQYPALIRNNSGLILNHINKSKWSDAEKYFFHQFGYLIMRIVEQMPWDMTIWYYRGQMLKVVPNKYIANKDYSNISNLSITELPKYF